MVAGYCVLGHADGVVGGVHRQVQRVGAVKHVPTDNDAATGPPVGLQAVVQIGSGAGVNEGGGSVLQQFGDGEQRSGVFVLRRHCRLQLENVGQIVRAQVVGKQAPDDVGIADVHMPVDESGSHYHSAGVNHRVGSNLGQLSGLAHLADSVPGYDDGSIGDDAPFRVHRHHVASVVDFCRRFRHFASGLRTLAHYRRCDARRFTGTR